MIKQPNFNISELIGILAVALSYMFYLYALHIVILQLNSSTANVLTTLFTISLNLYVAMIIFGVVYMVIKLLRWLVWRATTPLWKREENKN